MLSREMLTLRDTPLLASITESLIKVGYCQVDVMVHEQNYQSLLSLGLLPNVCLKICEKYTGDLKPTL